MVKAFSLFLLAILTACGGGGGSNTSGSDIPAWTGMVVHSGNLGEAALSTSKPTLIGDAALSTPKLTLNGVVLDGAIEGATVCLDLNINLSCGSGEPSTTTAADGSYSLSLVGLNLAQIRGAHIISAVPTTAKDADDGGKTLAQAGKAAFNLMSPVEPFVSADGTSISSVVVSPMTTLISHEMMSGVGKNAALAEANVVSALGLANGTNLRANFASQNDPTNVSLQKQARFVAAALGEVKKLIATSSASSTDRERQIGALNYLRANATSFMAAANTSSALAAGAQWSAAKAALSNNAVMPAPATSALVAGAQSFAATSTTMDTTVLDWNTAITRGSYRAYCGSGGSSSGSGFEYNCNLWRLQKLTSDAPGRFIYEQFDLSGATWTLSPSYPTLTSNGWATGGKSAGSFIEDGKGGVNLSLLGREFNTRLTEKDIGGKTVSNLIGSDNLPTAELAYVARYLPSSFKDVVFPPGSKTYASRVTTVSDQYQIYSFVGRCGSDGSSFTTLTELISKHLTGTNCSNFAFQAALPLYSDGLNASFDAGGSATQGTLTVWSSLGSPPFISTKLADKGRYEVRTVYGEPLLFLFPPDSVVTARKTPQRESFFTVYNGSVRYGDYVSAAYVNSNSTDSVTWNDIAINAILAGAGLPPVPQ